MKRDQPRATCRWTWIDQWCVETEEVIVHYRLPSMYASLFSHTHCLHYKQRVGGEVPLTSTRGLLVCTAFLTSLSLSLSLSIDGENAKMKKRQEMVYIFMMPKVSFRYLFVFIVFTIVPDIRLIRVAIDMERQWKNTAVGEVKIISHRTGKD